MICDARGCVRGLVHRAEGWADPCRVCGGSGVLRLATLCRSIDEHESTVRRLLKPKAKMRPRVAARILDKIVKVIG